MKVDEISRWATSAVITFLLVVGGLFADYAFRSGLNTTEGLSALAVAIILFIGVGYSALNFRRLCEAIHKRDIMKKRLQKIKKEYRQKKRSIRNEFQNQQNNNAERTTPDAEE